MFLSFTRCPAGRPPGERLVTLGVVLPTQAGVPKAPASATSGREEKAMEITVYGRGIKSFSEHPGLRLDVSNGRTLCSGCHKKTDTYGRNRHANK